MKTTLKRGIGRAAELNGNGRAVYPPLIQPPIRRYRQPEPEPRGPAALVGKIFLWLLIAVLMLAGGVAGGFYLYVEQDIARGLQASSFDVEVAEEKLDAVIPGQPTTALLLGYDRRAGIEAAETGQSDTLMLVRADPESETVTLLSFPRDLLVEVHGCEDRGPFVARINSAYGECGPQAALETVRRLTGVPVNYLVLVNFRGFTQIVANLGGVWLDVDRRYFNDNTGGGERYATIDLQPGYQKLSGQKALDFVRYRHTDSDFFRLARQQRFVKAVKQRIEDFSALDLPRMVSVVTNSVEVGSVGEFNARTILGYALFAYDLPVGNVFQARIDPLCFQGYAELTVAQTCVQSAVTDFLEPDVEAPTKATDVALGRKPKATAPAPSQTTLTVLNGNGRAGSATIASTQLGARGYQLVYPPAGPSGANAPSFEYFYTEVYYDESPTSVAAARELAKLFGNARVQPLPPEIQPLANGAQLTVVVGQTYHGTIASAPADRTPERETPQVKQDGSATPLLQEAAQRVPYPLLTPTRIEQASRLDSRTPIRVYNLSGTKAVRLTYTTGAGEFWGVQMTSWKDAPALVDPSEVVTLGGRTFRLYYNGPRLQMVVLETPAATYWVVNTLLGKLSNDTMLEIAKGLRPLPPG